MRHANKPRKQATVNQTQAPQAPKIWDDLKRTARMHKSERVSLVRLNEEFARLYRHIADLHSQTVAAAKRGREAKVSTLLGLIVRATVRCDEIQREAYGMIAAARKRETKRGKLLPPTPLPIIKRGK